MTYKWDCRTVEVYTTKGKNTNVVHTIHYRVTGSKEGYSTTNIGTQSINTDNIKGFLSFDKLTNEYFTEWTIREMGEYEVTEMEANLLNIVNALITPTTRTITIE
jgi:hypothetical protein